MLPYRDSRITTLAIIAFFLVVCGYAYYEARGFIYGPRITVSERITEVRDPFVVIRGTAERISSLSMNGKDISVTEEGVFEEPFLLAEGLNRITLGAKDKYERERTEVLQIVYTPAVNISLQSTSTSTPATSTSGITP